MLYVATTIGMCNLSNDNSISRSSLYDDPGGQELLVEIMHPIGYLDDKT